MRKYVIRSHAVAALAFLLAACPGPGQEMRAQPPEAAPVRGAPEPKINGPDRVEPFHIGRYAARPEFPFYSWRLEPGGGDVQPFHGNQYVDIVANPGKYKLILTVGGRRGRNSEVSKDIEFLAAEDDAPPPDGVDSPPPDPPAGEVPGVPGPLDNHVPITNPELF